MMCATFHGCAACFFEAFVEVGLSERYDCSPDQGPPKHNVLRNGPRNRYQCLTFCRTGLCVRASQKLAHLRQTLCASQLSRTFLMKTVPHFLGVLFACAEWFVGCPASFFAFRVCFQSLLRPSFMAQAKVAYG